MVYVVLTSSLITLVTTGFQLYGNYKYDIQQIDGRLNEIEKVHLSGLASLLWIADINELKKNLVHFLVLPDVEYLEIIENNKSLIRVGVNKKNNVIQRQYPLIFKQKNKATEIGTLIVHATLDGIHQRIFDQAVTILVTNAIKTFLITGFILFLFHHLVTRHLLKFAQFAKTLHLDNLDHTLILDRKNNKSEKPDELDILVDAFNRMQKNLKVSIDRLNENWERYRRLVESSRAIPWEMDLSTWRYTYIGPQIESVVGYKPDEWYENNFWVEHLHPDDREDAIRLCQTSTEKLEDHEFKYRMIAKDGHNVWIQDDVRVVIEANKAVKLHGYMFDITKKIENERELELYHKQLEKLVDERTRNLTIANEELESFSYSVSHDLRSPLRAIHGFSLALLEDCEKELNVEGKDYLTRIIYNTKRMSNLIDDILNLSRITRSKITIEKVDINDIANEIAANLKEEYPERSVNFTAKCNQSVLADSKLLAIVLNNLLGNAWKYTNKKEHAVIVFDSHIENNELVFKVKDNGAGYNMSYADNLFGVFQRMHTDVEFEGTGIGLATVKRIIERHGGRVWAQGEINKGAIFYFTLKPQYFD